MYSVQVNRFGIVILCKGSNPRTTYSVIYTTDNYNDALRFKLNRRSN